MMMMMEKGISNVCLKFGIYKNWLIWYCGSDYRGNLESDGTKLTLISFGGTTISWLSSLQHVTIMSTIEAELMPIVESFKEAKN